MRITRATIAGIVGGLLMLGVVAGFAIGLPKAVGDESESSAPLPTLPDRLGDQVVAISAVTSGEMKLSDAQLARVHTVAARQDADGARKLADLYGGDAVVRSYLDFGHPDVAAQSLPNIAVSVVRTQAGLVFPNGPLAANLDGTHYNLSKVDGFQCAGSYRDPQPATQMSQATGVQYGTSECRTEHNGFTYDVYDSGTSVKDTAAYLKTVIAG